MSIRVLLLAGLVLVASIRIAVTPRDLSFGYSYEMLDAICASFNEQSAYEMVQLMQDPELMVRRHYENIEESPARMEMLRRLMGKPGLEALFRVEKQVQNTMLTQWMLTDSHVNEPFSNLRVGRHLHRLFHDPMLRELLVEHILTQEVETMESYEWVTEYLKVAESDQITWVFKRLQHVMSPELLLEFVNNSSIRLELLQLYLEEGGIVRYLNAVLVWKMFYGTKDILWEMENLISDHEPEEGATSALHNIGQILQRNRKGLTYGLLSEAIEELNDLRNSLPGKVVIDGIILVLLAESSENVVSPESKEKLFHRAFEITQPAHMPISLVHRFVNILHRQSCNVSTLLTKLPRNKWPKELLSLEERRLLWLQHVPMETPSADLLASVHLTTLIESLWDDVLPVGPFSALAIDQVDPWDPYYCLPVRKFRNILIALPYLVATRQRIIRLDHLFSVDSWETLLFNARCNMCNDPRLYELDLWQQIIQVSYLKYFFTPQDINNLISSTE